MNKFNAFLFFFIILTPHLYFAQEINDTIQLDTNFTIIRVIYQPTENSTYFYKKKAVFAESPSQIAIEKTFSNNHQNGVYKVYYPSGRLRIFSVFANDKLNGEWTWYNENGTILIKGEYKDGIKDGYWAYKYMRTYGRYKDGLKKGIWKHFDENNKKYKSFYRKGKLMNAKKSKQSENNLLITSKDVNIVKDTAQNSNIENIDKEYLQATNFLKSNFILKKHVKAYFSHSIKEQQQIKKLFKNGVFHFVLSPNISPLSLSTFIQKSKENKIAVSKIDSVLKTESLIKDYDNFSPLNKDALYFYSTDTLSPITIYFSKIKNGLLRLDIVKNQIKEKINLSEKQNTLPNKETTYKVLLYYDKNNFLKGAEYQD